MAVKCILTGQEKVNLSGDTMTGDLKVGSSSIGTNGYIEGTWLKTTKATENAGDFATISGDGLIYKRKPANVLGDIGGQAKITANGFLKGNGTGVITADKPVFWVTVTQNTTDNLYSADKTYSEIIEAYNNGYMVQAKYSIDDGTNKEIYSLMSTYRSGSVKMLYFVYLNDHEEKRFTCRVTATAEKWLYKESSLVPSNLTINNKPLSSNITLTPSDINAQSKITANGILKGDGTGTITAADETEVELVDITPELIGAQPKIIANGFLTSDGEGNVGSENPVLTVEVWLRGAPTQDETGQYIYDFGSNYNYEQIRSAQHRGYMVVVYYSGDIFYYTGENSNDGLIFSKIGKRYSTCSYDRLRCTSDDKWHQESNTLVSEEGIFPAANGRFTLPEIIQNLQTSVQDAAPYTKICSVSVPTANWQGPEPYTQSISCDYNVTSLTMANIQLSDVLYDQLVADNVTYLNIANSDGRLFIKAKGGKPSVDLTLQITCTEIR